MLDWLRKTFPFLFTKTPTPKPVETKPDVNPIQPPPQKKLAKHLTLIDLNNMLNDWYQGELGVMESGGNNRGERVQYYQKTVDNVAQDESWCQAYMFTGLLRLCEKLVQFDDLKHLKGRDLYKLVPIYKSESTQSTYSKTDKKYIIPKNLVTFDDAGLSLLEFCWFTQQQISKDYLGHVGKVLRITNKVLCKFLTNEGNADGPQTGKVDGVNNLTRDLLSTNTKTMRGFIKVVHAVYDTVQAQSKG